MLRDFIYVGETPHFSDCDGDFVLWDWIKAQEWYNPEKEYIAIIDINWACHDIIELK